MVGVRLQGLNIGRRYSIKRIFISKWDKKWPCYVLRRTFSQCIQRIRKKITKLKLFLTLIIIEQNCWNMIIKGLTRWWYYAMIQLKRWWHADNITPKMYLIWNHFAKFIYCQRIPTCFFSAFLSPITQTNQPI